MNYGLKESKIWKRLEQKCADYGEFGELGSIQKLCDDAAALSNTIRDTFPRYTLHDETHINNVLRWMERILGDDGIEKLSEGECAMLLLAACFHDAGMCYTEEQRNKELQSARFSEYLEKNPGAYLAVEKSRAEGGAVPESVRSEYFRKIHPLRAAEMMPEEWPAALAGRDKLIAVCRSHGENMKDMIEELRYDRFQQTDYVLCAVLLRLADILDFDVSRAPHVLHEFQKISTSGDMTAAVEWGKHQESKGFKLLSESAGEKTPEGALKERRILAHRSVCKTMQGEHAISEFLDYVDRELESCRLALQTYGQEKWKTLRIPEKVEREIERRGYQSGEYCLTLEADNVLDLLVGDNVYSADYTFIRELLQNALDAVRARRALDRRFDWKQKDQILLSDWIDGEGYQWFRIDDCGIGMTEEMIRNFFLRAGRSYYKSDEFRKLQYENKSQYDFSPISQFGIGILSCFLNGDRMEVSTRHYDKGSGIRFSMKGTRGYYSLAVEEKGDKGTPMPGAASETEGGFPPGNFRQSPGTSIAVRLKAPLSESVGSAIRACLCFPDIPVRYRNGTETIDFPTEQELMALAKKTGEIRIPFSDEFMQRLDAELPGIVWQERPYIRVKCNPLDEASESPLISGVHFVIDVVGTNNLRLMVGAGNIHVMRYWATNIMITRNCVSVHMKNKIKNSVGNDLSLSEFVHQYRNRTELVRWCAERFDRQEPLENILKEISEKGMRKKVENIYRDLQSLALMTKWEGVCLEENIPFAVNDGLKEMMERCILPRCDTGAKYLTNFKVEKGYNGIGIETDWDFMYEHVEYKYTALLLSGEFQPRFDISRKKIHIFPMKAAGYIELLGNRLGISVFSCNYSNCFSRMEYGQFMELLDDTAFCELVENVRRFWNEETLKEIRESLVLMPEKEKIPLADYDESFYGLDEFSYKPDFLKIFRKALLQKEFELCWDVNRSGAIEYFVTGVRRTPVSEAEKVFLPLTFVHSFRGNTETLVIDCVMERHSLNADHPFSVWLMSHAEYLSKKQPSLWKRMRENICELDSGNMMTAVNTFLKEIQRREGMSIPDNVWLKEKDFFKRRS